MIGTGARRKLRINLTTFGFALPSKFQWKRILYLLSHFFDTRVWNATRMKNNKSFYYDESCFTHWKSVDTSEWNEHTTPHCTVHTLSACVTKCHFESCVILFSLLPISLCVKCSPCRFIRMASVHRGRACASYPTIWFWTHTHQLMSFLCLCNPCVMYEF